MADFENWNELVEDAEKLGGLACYQLDTLLIIYGVDRAGTQANNDIIDSLERRGYGIQPRRLTMLDPETWVRLYKKETSIGRLIDVVESISPADNEKLRVFARRYEQNDNVKKLIAFAKTIVED